ncbi:hypothetical protein [Ardenticatena maritima]|uniref:hypothetical protein n=1 Tax=Ardenticatena maritima TaxID=872965 RepID=UPI0006C89A89|nr:hypothetical protein [Ardenticatena maritima]
MSQIVEDVIKAAEWASQALQQSGYPADFSPSSLWYVDFFFDDHSRNGEPIPGGLLSQDIGVRLFAIGAYVGEVLRRHLGGEWYGDDNDPQAEINVALRLNTGATCWPVQRVIKRFENGWEESVAAYGAGMGLQVGPRPLRSPRTSPKKPWWKFW